MFQCMCRLQSAEQYVDIATAFVYHSTSIKQENELIWATVIKIVFVFIPKADKIHYTSSIKMLILC